MSLLNAFYVLRNFLDPHLSSELWRHALENQACFEHGLVGSELGVLSTNTRKAGVLRSWVSTELALGFAHRISASSGDLMTNLNVVPFEVTKLELEMAQHGDSGCYRRHIDTLSGCCCDSADRVLSCVYYFHGPEKRFSGGILRLFPLPLSTGAPDPIEIEPEHNKLVVFPSWLPHEVMETHVPSGRFEDSRFSISCWLYKASKRTAD